MANESTIGAKLRALRARTSLSLADLAKAAGYNGASSVQRYFEEDYDPPYLPGGVAERLASAFRGTPVLESEVMALARPILSEGRAFRFEGASDRTMRRDVPAYGTALGATEEIEGVAIEQTDLNTGEIITYLPRPVVLEGRSGVYGLFVQGSSMSPRFEQGDTLFVDEKRPPRVGDDVVVHLVAADPDGGDTTTAVLVKRLVRQTATYVELEQFQPAKVFKLDRRRAAKIHRVIPYSELLS